MESEGAKSDCRDPMIELAAVTSNHVVWVSGLARTPESEVIGLPCAPPLWAAVAEFYRNQFATPLAARDSAESSAVDFVLHPASTSEMPIEGALPGVSSD